jgi:hypothetical protein
MIASRFAETAFWLGCLGAVLGNAYFFQARAAVYAAADPPKLKEANGIVRALVVYAGGLVLLGAAGAALGWTGRTFSPTGLSSSRLTFFDIVYLAIYVGVLFRASWWVYFKGGAELLADHQEMFRFFPSTGRGVMVLWAVAMVLIGYGFFENIVGRT